MEDYSKYTDEELIGRIRSGEKEISDYLIGKYKNLVRKLSRSMHILGGDSDDLLQEGMIGLYKAIRDYDENSEAGFMTFAQVCVQRQLYSAVSAANRKKHMPLNEYISIYATGRTSDEDEGMPLAEVLGSVTDESPEKLFMDSELLGEIDKIIETELSSLEREVMRLCMTGMTSSEAAGILNRDFKSTDNAYTRAKSKIRKALESK